MIYHEQTKRAAFHLDLNGEVRRVNRIPFMTDQYDENWLQSIIEANPDILPLEQFDGKYNRLICVGREIPVGTGSTKGFIDNLLISPSGEIVIVETKLFRNQESRRTVIAQIIEYAKELQKWDAEMLDDAVSDYYFKKSGQGMRMIDLMTSDGLLSYSDEAEFTDSINNNLSDARFLLAIVGDGIRTGLLQLADFLNYNTFNNSSVALVALELYEDDNGILIVPNLLLRTSVIERTVYSMYEYRSEIRNKHSYVKKPTPSRQEFINFFSENGGFDVDEVTELVYDIDMINGLFITVSPTEMAVKFKAGERNCPLLTFGISGNRADLYILPDKMRECLQCAGFFDWEANDFLEFYRQYIDIPRCKALPYCFGENRYYYADVSKVLSDKANFERGLEQFAMMISKG